MPNGHAGSFTRRSVSRVLPAIAGVPAPEPNLAKRIESSDVIFVGRLTSGATLASGSQVSSDIVLHVDRVLKGDLTPGSEIATRLEGRGYFMAANAKQTPVDERLYGIWFLNSTSRPYTIVSRDGQYGELHFAPVILLSLPWPQCETSNRWQSRTGKIRRAAISALGVPGSGCARKTPLISGLGLRRTWVGVHARLYQ